MVIAIAAAACTALRRDWRPFGIVLFTSVASMVVHPHYPDNVILFWYQGPEVVVNALCGNYRNVVIPDELTTGVRQDLVMGSLVPILAFITGLVRRTTEPVLGVLQLVFLGMTAGMLRFVEYFVPLVSLGASPTFRFVYPNRPWYAKCIVTALLLAVVAVQIHHVFLAARASASPEYRGAALWLNRNHVSGYVFNAQWDSYAELRYFAMDTIVAHGQDPIFVAAVDPRLSRSIQRATEGQMPVELSFRGSGFRFL